MKLIFQSVILLVLLIALIAGMVLFFKSKNNDNNKDKKPEISTAENVVDEESSSEESQESTEGTVIDTSDAQIPSDIASYHSDNKEETLALATKLYMMYDYDSAVAVCNGYVDAANDSDIQELINKCNTTKASCVPVDVTTVPHVFFHSLLVDTRGFNADLVGESKAKGNGCWMCTVDEFKAVLQQMYDSRCVLIRIRDLAVETVNEDGTVTFSPNTNLLLPEGKKAVIMSEDDLSYYHSYDNQGYASKLVLDENGKVKCEYTDPNGNTSVGDYDCVPILESFIEEHPDFSYKNAHLTIAMTGYNGCFGYRTDVAYKTGENLTEDQRQWLDAHPDFNWDQDVAEATKIAEAIKAEGFEFASHTWGHLRAGSSDLELLSADNDRFTNTVKNIIGDVDTIIFAHGEDIGDWHDYSSDNEKFNYYKSQGYNYFCNVDGSTPYWIQIRNNYVRTGRVNIDGYRLYRAMVGDEHSVADMNAIGVHDIDTFFCQDRITPVELTG